MVFAQKYINKPVKQNLEISASIYDTYMTKLAFSFSEKRVGYFINGVGTTRQSMVGVNKLLTITAEKLLDKLNI